MKHIKRRFYFQKSKKEFLKDDDNMSFFDKEDITSEVIKQEVRDKHVFIETEDEILGAIAANINGKHFLIPVPDPTLIYFNNAQLTIKQIRATKDILIEKLDYSLEDARPPLHELYDYFGAVSSFVIFLFTAIESFVNSNIPDDYVYINRSKKNTEHYNKDQIQNYIDLKTKLKIILKEITTNNFFKKDTPMVQLIWKLKEFRDEIVHTKQSENIMKYEHLIKESLNFKFEKSLEAVAKMMNYYRPEYILECNCGADF